MIESYEFGRIVIDGKEYCNDVIIFPEKLRSEWWRKEGHYLQMEDLEEVFREKPKLLIIGTGHSGVMKVSPLVREFCTKQNIQLIEELTRDAVKKYNELAGPGVIGAFHLTC
jgi:hypothetical protein